MTIQSLDDIITNQTNPNVPARSSLRRPMREHIMNAEVVDCQRLCAARLPLQAGDLRVAERAAAIDGMSLVARGVSIANILFVMSASAILWSVARIGAARTRSRLVASCVAKRRTSGGSVCRVMANRSVRVTSLNPRRAGRLPNKSIWGRRVGWKSACAAFDEWRATLVADGEGMIVYGVFLMIH
jgi:hypothetical protein